MADNRVRNKQMRSQPLFIRVLVMRQGPEWLAQGLEYDLSAQGANQKQAIAAFLAVLRGHLTLDKKHGRRPLEGVHSAPERFVEAFEKLQQNAEPTVQHLDQAGDIPPAYVLHAIAQNIADLDLNQ